MPFTKTIFTASAIVSGGLAAWLSNHSPKETVPLTNNTPKKTSLLQSSSNLARTFKPNARESWRLARQLLEWTEHDPKTIIDWASDEEERLDDAWTAWGIADFSAAVSAAPDDRKTKLLKTVMVVNPGAVVDWAENHPALIDKYRAELIVAAGRLAATEPERGIAFFEKRLSDQDKFPGGFIRELARHSPEEAARAVEHFKLPPKVLHLAMYHAASKQPEVFLENFTEISWIHPSLCNGLLPVIKKKARDNMEEAISLFHNIDDPTIRTKALSYCLPYLVDTDPEKALSLIKQTLIPSHTAEEKHILRKLFKKNPAEAFEIAFRHRDTKRYRHSAELVQSWIKEDPFAATEKINNWLIYAENLEDLYLVLSKNHPDQKIKKVIDSLLEGPLKKKLATSLLPNLINEQEFENTLAWGRAIDPKKLPRLAWLELGKQLPAVAEKKFNQLTKTNDREIAADGLFESLLHKKQFSALPQILRSLPSSPTDLPTLNPYKKTAAQWAEKDLIAATRWINRLKKNSYRNHAIQGIMEHFLKAEKYKSALQWIARQTQPEDSPEAVEVFERWLQRAPENALKFAHETSLPETMRQQLLELE